MADEVEKLLFELLNKRKQLPGLIFAEKFLSIAEDYADRDGFPVCTFLISFSKSVLNDYAKNHQQFHFSVIERTIACFSGNMKTRRLLLTTDGIVTSLITLIFSNASPFELKKGALEILNQIASLKISQDCRFGVLNKYEPYFVRLTKMIPYLGDYEAQIMTIEVLIRFCAQQDFLLVSKLFKDENLATNFAKIERKRFEAQCRPLLNAINKKLGNKALVRSYPCQNMKVGMREIRKPLENDYHELWIDFNISSKVIRVYCQKQPTQDVNTKWDSMAIEASDILKYNIHPSNGTKILTIQLIKEGYLLFDSSAESRFPGFQVTMQFRSNTPIQETMQELSNKSVHSPWTPSDQGSQDLFDSQPPKRASYLITRIQDVNQDEIPEPLPRQVPERVPFKEPEAVQMQTNQSVSPNQPKQVPEQQPEKFPQPSNGKITKQG